MSSNSNALARSFESSDHYDRQVEWDAQEVERVRIQHFHVLAGKVPAREDVVTVVNDALAMRNPGLRITGDVSTRLVERVAASYFTPKQVAALMSGQRLLPANTDTEV